MADAAAPKLHDECFEIALSRIREGFADIDEITDGVFDTLAGEAELDDTVVSRAIGEALDTFLREQKTWPRLTDCDRLDRAFEILERGGIVARQNYWCCQTCGSAAIHDEMLSAAEDGEPVRGYVFYHEQDTEGAAGYGQLYLAYGSFSGEDSDSVAIGKELVIHLEEVGLEPRWGGKLDERISVDVDWKRRRAGDGRPLLPSTAEQQ